MSDPTEPKPGVDPEEDVLEDVVRDCEQSTHYTPKLRERLASARDAVSALRTRAERSEAIVERVAAIFRLVPKTPGDFSGLPAIVEKFARGLETIAKQADAADAKAAALKSRLAEQNRIHAEAVRGCNDVAVVLAAERRQAEEQAELERARADRAEEKLAILFPEKALREVFPESAPYETFPAAAIVAHALIERLEQENSAERLPRIPEYVVTRAFLDNLANSGWWGKFASHQMTRADKAEARLANVVFEIDQCVERCGCEPGTFCESFGCGTLCRIRAVAISRREP